MKKEYFTKILVLFTIFITAGLWPQSGLKSFNQGLNKEGELLFSEDFSTGSLAKWQFYRFSTGLHGAVPDPYIENGRVNITTRDQQRTFLSAGSTAFYEYSLSAEARIEQAYDDANRQIIFYFYIRNIGGTYQNYQDILGYSFSISARESRWYLMKHNYPQSSNILLTGSKTFTSGLNYQFEMVPTASGFEIYFYEKGQARSLITSYNGLLSEEKNGYFGFGGGDDRISVDNVYVNGLNSQAVNSLRAYYPLNGNTNDSSGNGQNGQPFSLQYTTDRFGNQNGAGLFDGVNSEVIIIPDTVLSRFAAGDHTASAWFRLSETTVYQKFIVDYGETTRDQEGLRIETGGRANFKWVTRPAYLNSVYGKTRLETGVWYHIAATVQGSKGKLYLNGVLVDSMDNGALPDTTRFLTFKIGNISGGGPGGIKFKGAIDDVRLFSTALSEEEIKILYTERGWNQKELHFVKSLWNGSLWSGGIRTGDWFPAIDSFAVFNQPDNSLTELISSESFSGGKRIRFKLKPWLASQSANASEAFFGIGSGLGGDAKHFAGLRFRNGIIQIYEKYFAGGVKDTAIQIGSYESGVWEEPEIVRSANGTLKIKLGENEYLYTPSVNSDEYRLILAGANSVRGFDVSRVSTDSIFYELIRVADPDGGEVLRGGTDYVIKWTSTGVGFVNIDYTTDGGLVWYPVAVNFKDTSFYRWPLPEISSGKVKIRVQKTGDPSVGDISDSDFRIVTPSLTLLNPNGGEVWKSGDKGLISWNGSDVDSVRIALRYTDSLSWKNIYESVAFLRDTVLYPVDESYPDGDYLIKITDVRYQDVSDSGNASFRIVKKLRAPVNLSADTFNINDVVLNWADSQNFTHKGYLIQRAEGDSLSGGDFITIDTASAAERSYTDADLIISKSFTNFRYRVQAYNDYDSSAFSNHASARIIMPRVRMTFPQDSSRYLPTPLVFFWEPIRERHSSSALFYNLRVARDPGFNTVIFDTLITDTLINVPLRGGEKLYWSVRSRLHNANSDSNQFRLFMTELEPPSNLSYTLQNINDVTLNWQLNSVTEDTVFVYRNDGGGIYFPIKALAAGSESYTDTSLLLKNQTTSYSYLVQAKNEIDTSLFSNSVTVNIGIGTPQLISPGDGIRELERQVDFRWSKLKTLAEGSPVYYRIQISEDAEFAGNAVADSVVTDTALTYLLQDGKKYYWRVKSLVSNSSGTFSEPFSFVTRLYAPHGLTAVSKNISEIELSWNHTGVNESGFIIYRKQGDSLSPYQYSPVSGTNTDILSYTDTGAVFYAIPSLYTYKVNAYNGQDTSEFSDQLTVSLQMLPVEPVFPGDNDRELPENCELRWNKLITAPLLPLIKYHLRVSEDSQFTSNIYDELITDTSKVLQLKDGVRYYWNVRAVVNSVTGPGITRSFVTSLRGSQFTAWNINNINDATLQWTDPGENETGYILERKNGSTADTADVYQVIKILPGNTTVTTDSNLIIKDTNAVYSYRISAFSQHDTSALSNPIQILTGIEKVRLAEPVNGLLNSDENVRFTWERINSVSAGSVVYYQLEISESAAFNQLVFSDSTITDSSRMVNLQDGKKYYWRVRAKVTQGRGNYSEVRSLTTDLNSASSLALKALNINDIRLDWTNNTLNAAAHIIERKAGDSLSASQWTVIANLPSVSVSYTDQEILLNGAVTTYSYRLRSYSSYDTSGYSNVREIRVGIATVEPVMPENYARDLEQNITLNWKQIRTLSQGSVVRYNLLISESADFSGEAFCDTVITDTSLTLFFEDGKNYFWKVKALVSGGEGFFSSTRQFTTELKKPFAGYPVIRNINDVVLNWEEATSNEAGFIIQRKTGDSLTGNPYITIGATTANTTYFTDTNAVFYELPSKYTYRVFAYNSADTSLPGNQITVSLRLAPVLLSSPADEAREITEISEFRWERLTTVSAASVVWYNIQISENQTMIPPVYDVTVTDTFKQVTLEDGKRYYWRVRPVVNGVTGQLGSIRSLYTKLRVPALSGKLVKNINDVELIWTDPTLNETGYIVERKKGFPSDSLWIYQPVMILAQNTTAVTDTGLNLQDTINVYTYRIRAFSPFDTSNSSNEESVTIGIETVTILLPENNLYNSDETVDFQWKRLRTLSSGSSVYYHLQISEDSTFTGFYFSDSTLTDTLKTVVLQDGKRYFWRVRAKVTEGKGNYSEVRKITTDLNSVSALTLNAYNINDVKLDWRNNTVNADSILIQRKAGDSTQVADFMTIAIVPGSDSVYTDSSVAVYNNPSQYSYRLIACNMIDTASPGNARMISLKLQTVNQIYPPDSVRNLPENIGFSWNRIRTEWEGSQVNYNLQVSGSPVFDTLLYNLFITDSSAALIFEDGMKYYWRVRPIVDGVYGDSGVVRNFVTELRKPLELASSVALINDITLAWADSSANEQGFIVERREGDSTTVNPFIQIALLPANTTAYLDSAVQFTGIRTYYSYRVYAINQNDTSLSSNITFSSMTISQVTSLSPENSERVLPDSVKFVWNRIRTLTEGSVVYYQLQISDDTEFNNILFNDSTITDSTIRVNLEDGKRYYWRIRAEVTGVNGLYDTASMFITRLRIPDSLSVSVSNLNDVKLTWSENSLNETNYVIERKSGDSLSIEPFFEIRRTGQNTSEITDSNLTISQIQNKYTYRIHCYNAVDTSYRSKMVTATVGIRRVTQLTPQNYERNISDTASFIWNRLKSIGEAIDPVYELQIAREASFTNIVFLDSTITDTIASVSLEDGQKYFWRIRAIVNGIRGQYSETWNFTTELRHPDNLFVTGSSIRSISLQWDDISTRETGYFIERRTGDTSGTSPFLLVGIKPSGTVTFTDSSFILYSDTSVFTYRIKCFNQLDTSSASNSEIVSVYLTVPVLVTPADNSGKLPLLVHFNWKSPDDDKKVMPEGALRIVRVNGKSVNKTETEENQMLSYNFQLSGDSTFIVKLIDSVLTDTNLTLPLRDGRKYYWRVRTKLNVYTDFTDPFRFTTRISAPQNLRADTTAGYKIKLSWTDISSSEEKVVIERKDGDSSGTVPYLIIAEVDSAVTEYTDLNVTGGGQFYTYRIKNYNALDTSVYSNTASVRIITGISEPNGLPEKFDLSQNYPNPFNPSTIIKFALPEESDVTLSVYDVTGCKVLGLVRSVLTAGYYTAALNANNLSSGVYILRMEAVPRTGKRYTFIRKMVLMK